MLAGLRLVAGILLGILLIVAGLGKAVYHGEFRATLLAYGIIPERLVPPAAISLAALECLAGIGIMGNIAGPLPHLCAVALFVCLGTAVAFNLLRGRADLPCGCFGRRGERISWQLVGRNLGLAGLALFSSGTFAIATVVLLGVCATSILVPSFSRATAPSPQAGS